jgi:hypothetical protein
MGMDPAQFPFENFEATAAQYEGVLDGISAWQKAFQPEQMDPNDRFKVVGSQLVDLGAEGDPLEALSRIIEVAKGDMSEHIVVRELIALSDGSEGARPVLGMFLGGAGLAETILYCRHKIYPLGLPNGLSHFLTAIAVMFSAIVRVKASFLPQRSKPVSITFIRNGELHGTFSVLIVTTLEKLLLGGQAGNNNQRGLMKFLAVDQTPLAMLKMMAASLRGKLGQTNMRGVHFQHGDVIRIDSEQSSVVLDGEVFQAHHGSPIVLRSTPPVPFLKLAA